jgi:nitrogenase subunit NifH
MRKIAIYGKGGIGKSTATQNTVAGLPRWVGKLWWWVAIPRRIPPACCWTAWPKRASWTPCGKKGKRTLARKIEANEMHIIPKPMSADELEKLLIDYGLVG